MSTWLCGPISADFPAAEAQLRALNLGPTYGPHDIGSAITDPDLRNRERIKSMMSCDTVCLLDGWAGDAQALLEFDLGKRLGMRVVDRVVLLAGA